jgi:glyoxylase-like metal-dependent hydrolase (beta-lactamase superfamily II)
VQIVEDVHLIKCPHRHFFTSVCAVLGKEIALIDAGITTSPEDAILPYLISMGRKPEEISHVILTHGHWDHYGGASLLKKRYSVKVAVHELDKPFVEDASLAGRQLSGRFGTPLHDTFFSKEAQFASVQTDITVKDGDALTVAGHEFTFLHLPGHSPGSMAVIDRKLGLYMAGDTPQGSGPGRPLFFHGSSEYETSVKKLRSEPIERLVLGHPLPPFEKAVLNADEAKIFAKDSLAAAKELGESVWRTLKEAKKPSTLEEIQSGLPGAKLASVGCILEALVREGKARVLKTGTWPQWISAT